MANYSYTGGSGPSPSQASTPTQASQASKPSMGLGDKILASMFGAEANPSVTSTASSAIQNRDQQAISAITPIRIPFSNAPESVDSMSTTVLPRMGPEAGGAYGEMFSDLIPNVNFNRITLTGGVGGAPLKVKLNFVLRDIIEEDGISQWFANSFEDDTQSSPFEKYLKLNIIQCTNPDVCEVLSGRQSTQYLIDRGMSRQISQKYVVNKSVNLDSKINISSDPDAKEIQEYITTAPGGEEIIEVPFEETFIITPNDAPVVEHLSYFVWD